VFWGVQDQRSRPLPSTVADETSVGGLILQVAPPVESRSSLRRQALVPMKLCGCIISGAPSETAAVDVLSRMAKRFVTASTEKLSSPRYSHFWNQIAP
jgi:hypothetical protein